MTNANVSFLLSRLIMSNPNDQNYFYGQSAGMGQQAGYGWGDANQGEGISFDMDSNFGQDQLIFFLFCFEIGT